VREDPKEKVKECVPKDENNNSVKDIKNTQRNCRADA